MTKVTLRDGRVKEFKDKETAKRYAEVSGGVVAEAKSSPKKTTKKTTKKA